MWKCCQYKVKKLSGIKTATENSYLRSMPWNSESYKKCTFCTSSIYTHFYNIISVLTDAESEQQRGHHSISVAILTMLWNLFRKITIFNTMIPWTINSGCPPLMLSLWGHLRRPLSFLSSPIGLGLFFIVDLSTTSSSYEKVDLMLQIGRLLSLPNNIH